MKKRWGILISGAAAGAVNGLLGAGGGMVLVPLMTFLTDLKDDEIFPASISMILPICLVSLAVTAVNTGLPWDSAFPYLAGGTAGGLLSGLWGRKIPVTWLHRLLGVMVLWGGIRYLC